MCPLASMGTAQGSLSGCMPLGWYSPAGPTLSCGRRITTRRTHPMHDNIGFGDYLIRRGMHGGWSVNMSNGPQFIPASAYFSTIHEMLVWLKETLETTDQK